MGKIVPTAVNDTAFEDPPDLHSVKIDPSKLATVTFTVAKQELHAGPNSRKVGQKHASLGHVDAAISMIEHCAEQGI